MDKQACRKQTSNGCDETVIKHESKGVIRLNNNNNNISENKYGLHRDQVDPDFRVPFILTGYRKPNLTVLEYVQSALSKSCNETVNIWSHVIALLCFLWKFYDLFTSKYSVLDPMVWPLITSAIGICGFCIASSTAHTFSSMSLSAQNICFFMDYAAISTYSVGLGQAFYFYSRPLNPELTTLKSEWQFLMLSSITSITVTFLCCKTRTSWKKYRYIARTVFSAVPFFVNSSPYWYRIITCSNKTDCVSTASLWAFQIHFFICILSAIVNTLRFPENLLPGKFDLLGQSHHWLHLFVAIAASSIFDSFHYDMMARKTKLMQTSVQCSFMNTIFHFTATMVANFGISLAFSWAIICKQQRKPKRE